MSPLSGRGKAAFRCTFSRSASRAATFWETFTRGESISLHAQRDTFRLGASGKR